MLIGQTAEYALRAVVWLAAQPESALSRPAIARTTQVPAGYLSKVLQGLTRAGLLVSNAGRRGGFRLARPSADITVLEVVNAVSPIERIRLCPLGMGGHGGELCPLHRRLDQAIASMEEAFAQTTIEELVRETPCALPLCQGSRPDRKRRSAARRGVGRRPSAPMGL